VVVVGSRPDNRAVKRALVNHFPDWKRRWRIISSLGPLRTVKTNPDEPPIHYEFFGCSSKQASTLLKSCSYVSRLPEPLRVAGLLTTGLFGNNPYFRGIRSPSSGLIPSPDRPHKPIP